MKGHSRLPIKAATKCCVMPERSVGREVIAFLKSSWRSCYDLPEWLPGRNDHLPVTASEKVLNLLIWASSSTHCSVGVAYKGRRKKGGNRFTSLDIGKIPVKPCPAVE